MDDSEYELMKETKKLLELALKKEEDLNSEIKRLNNEKIEILEKSQKSISIITKTKRTSSAVSIDWGYDRLRNVIEDFLNKHYTPKQRGSNFILLHDLTNEVFKNHFQIVTTESEPEQSYVIVGLDEAKEELKTLLKNELDLEVKEKLARLIQLEKYYNEVVADRNAKNSKYREDLKALTAERDLIQYHHDDIQKMLKVELWKDSSLMMIRDTAEHATFWNRNKSIKRILELTNKPKEDGISS